MSSNGPALVVRYGPWARNLYLGLPAALAFGADNQPPAGVLIRTLTELTGLPYAN